MPRGRHSGAKVRKHGEHAAVIMGVGLAVAILLDATLIRAVLLPATMKLLGDANWYLPKRPHWLPRIAHEPARPRRE